MINKNQDTRYTSVTTLTNEKEKCPSKNENRNESKALCFYLTLLIGTLSLCGGFLCIYFDFFELVMQDRIKMRPGSIPMENWKNPPIWIGIQIHVFAVINSEEFLAGIDTKLKLQDVGPIYYRNYAKPINIVYENDSTLSFTTTNNLVFDEYLNEPGILNKTITIPNNMLLGMASYFYESSSFVKFAFNMVAIKDHVFLNRTVYQALWNLTSPILEKANKIPFISIRSNAGMLYNTFYPPEARYNALIGAKHGFENFFKINKLNDNEWLPAYTKYYPLYCPFWLNGTNDIASFPQFLNKTTPLVISYHNLCRTFSLQFNREIILDNIDAYEFILKDDTFKRLNDSSRDCLKKTNGLILPDGIIDASKCAYDLPIGISAPHFVGFNGEWNNYLEGLQPNNEKHSSVIIVEPKSGTVMVAKIGLQTNLIIPKLNPRYFSQDMIKFNNMVLPLYWLEYKLELDNSLRFLIKIISKYLPISQLILTVLLFSLSFLCVLNLVLTIRKRGYSKRFKKSGKNTANGGVKTKKTNKVLLNQ